MSLAKLSPIDVVTPAAHTSKVEPRYRGGGGAAIRP